MKFNFRKIASVLASTVMLSSTVALAAAANYPAPFVQSGAADVAVVYGSNNIAQTDLVAVADITANLNSMLTSQSTVSTSSAIPTTAKTPIGYSTEKLVIGADAKPTATSLGKSDLPAILPDGVYQSKDGVSYNYEQAISLGNLTYTHFVDTDYNSRMPTLGIKIPRSTPVLNYTLTFKKSVDTDVTTAGRLEDVENSELMILGKSYKLLNAYNTTNAKLELMSGAITDILSQDEQKTYTLSGKTYDVTVTFIDSTGVKFRINNEDITKISSGSTQKLSDGTQVGVREILYQGYSGGVQKVEFSLGADKITLEDGQNVKINDVTQYDLTAYVSRSAGSSGKQQLNSIKVKWAPDQASFVTANSTLQMPAFAAIQLLMDPETAPVKELIKVANTGSKTIGISVPIKDGTANIDILSGNGSNFNNIGGESGTGNNLITTNASTIVFDRDTDKAFVATYLSGTSGQSYYLSVGSIVRTDGKNYTTVKNLLTNDVAGNCDTKEADQISASSCTIGSVTLTFGSADADLKNVSITGGGNVYFDRIASAEGMVLYLPVDSAATSNALGQLNLSAVPSTWTIVAREEDKNGNLQGTTYVLNNGVGSNITTQLGWSSNKVQVSATPVAGRGFAYSSSMAQMPGTSTTYVDYVKSDIATKVTYDTVPDQDTATYEYHGGQFYGNLFLTASNLVTTTTTANGTTTGSVMSVKDSEVASVSTKNLIVVGGSCVNSVAAQLLGLPAASCGSDWEAKTGVGAGSFLIETFAQASGKVATLVAGYNAADTTNAAKYLTTQTVDTTAGKKYKGTSATVASLVTTA